MTGSRFFKSLVFEGQSFTDFQEFGVERFSGYRVA